MQGCRIKPHARQLQDGAHQHLDCVLGDVQSTRNDLCGSASHAISNLARDYSVLVSRFARLSRSRILAEDLVNDAVAESLAKLQARQIRDSGRFTGFVYRVAVNMLKNHRRRLCNRTDVRVCCSVLENLPAADDPFIGQNHNYLAARLRAAIAELPTERDRELIRRFYLDEEDKDSICTDMELSAAHFNKVMFRARQRVKTLLDDDRL